MFVIEVVDELAGYMVYCFDALGNLETTIADKLVAVNLFHEQWVETSLLLKPSDGGREGRKQKVARGRRHLATGEEAAVEKY